MGAAESRRRLDGSRGGAGDSNHDEAAQEYAADDASDMISASLLEMSDASVLETPRRREDRLGGRLNQAIVVRPETREFYEHLDLLFQLKETIEGVAAKVMPENAVAKYEDIKPYFVIQECVPDCDLSTQLDFLYSFAEEAKPKFDDFGRQLVQQVGLNPDEPMLEQAHQSWCVYTAAVLKARNRAMEKAVNECDGDARRVVDIVRASIVVDSEAAFEAVVKCLLENYVKIERDGVRVIRFKNRCKRSLSSGTCDVLYNISIMLNHYSSRPRFVCELQIHMKQILDYKEATHVPYEYFRSYFKGGDERATSERVVLLERFASRNLEDICHVVTSALEAGNEDQLDALDELFEKLSELEIVVSIRRRLLQLAQPNTGLFSFQRGINWLEFAQARRLGEIVVSTQRCLRKLAQPITVISWFEKGTDWLEFARRLWEIIVSIWRSLLESAQPNTWLSSYETGTSWLVFARRLGKLAIALDKQGKYDEAKPLYERSVRIQEMSLGGYHPTVASSLNNFANLLQNQGKYDEAKPLYERSLRIQETNFGEHHPYVAGSLNNLADLLRKQGKYDEAKPLYERSLRIQENNLGEHHLDVAAVLNNLANLLKDKGEYDEIKPLYERSLHIQETNLGEHHPDVASSLNNLANVLRDQGKYYEAKPLYERSLRIRENGLGYDHPDVASSLNDLGELLRVQGKDDEARHLIERSLQIRETVFGKHHSEVAYSLNNLAKLLRTQGKHDEARPLIERSLWIQETSLGEHHPKLTQTRATLALLSSHADACNNMERAVHIFDTVLGAEHPDDTQKSYRLYANISS